MAKDTGPRDRRRKRMIMGTLAGSADFVGMRDWLQILWVNGIILGADDEGRLKASPKGLQSRAWPEHPDVGEEAREELVDGLDLGGGCRPTPPEIAAATKYFHQRGMIVLYEVGGVAYAQITHWTRDQKLPRISPSLIPPPPGGDYAPPGNKQRNETNVGSHFQPTLAENLPKVDSHSLPNPDQIRSDQLRSDQHNPEAPTAPVIEAESGGPEENSGWGKPGSGAFCEPCQGAHLAHEAPHYVQKAWHLILEAAADWGEVRWPTLTRIYEHTRVAPERVLAAVLDIAGNEKVESPWGALSNVLKRKWTGSDTMLQRAKDMIRGSPGVRKDGTQTIGEILEETK